MSPARRGSRGKVRSRSHIKVEVPGVRYFPVGKPYRDPKARTREVMARGSAAIAKEARYLTQDFKIPNQTYISGERYTVIQIPSQ